MEKLNPNLPEDKQDMQLKPVVFGPPGYGSPDPATSAASLNDALDEAETSEEDAKERKSRAKSSSSKNKSDD